MSVKETTLEIKLENLKENFKFLKSRVSSSTKFMAVVKAFSYGSDSVIISKELEKIGADYLAVAYTNEGIELRENGIRLPILVLHPQEDDFENIINYSLEPSIYSFRIFTFFLKTKHVFISFLLILKLHNLLSLQIDNFLLICQLHVIGQFDYDKV